MISGWLTATDALARALNQAGAEGLQAEATTQQLLQQQQRLGLAERELGLEGLMSPYKVQQLLASAYHTGQLGRLVAEQATQQEIQRPLVKETTRFQTGVLGGLNPAEFSAAMREKARREAAESAWQTQFFQHYPAPKAAEYALQVERGKAGTAEADAALGNLLSRYYRMVPLPAPPKPGAPLEDFVKYAQMLQLLFAPHQYGHQYYERRRTEATLEAGTRARITDDVRARVGQDLAQLQTAGIKPAIAARLATTLTPIYTLEQYLLYADVVSWSPDELRQLYERAATAYGELERALDPKTFTGSAEDHLKAATYTQAAKRILEQSRAALQKRGVLPKASSSKEASEELLKRFREQFKP